MVGVRVADDTNLRRLFAAYTLCALCIAEYLDGPPPRYPHEEGREGAEDGET